MSGVGLVVVSHSAQVSDGIVAIAAQMAPGVRARAAGGGPDGGIGTDYDRVATALDAVDSGRGAVLLYDLGSAQMTAELAVEALGDPERARVAEAPLVEGTVAAAVAAQGGADLGAVADAARAAGIPEVAEQEADTEPVLAEPAERSEASRELVLRNEVGLHARPAALLVRAVTGLRAEITVECGEKRADATSVLALMGLAARRDDVIVVRANGPDAGDAVQRVADLVASDFAEP